MEWQHRSLDGFFGPKNGDVGVPRGTTARPKRWVTHAGHGGLGSTASSSSGPHLSPRPGRADPDLDLGHPGGR